MTIQVFLSYPRLVDVHDDGGIFSLCDNLEREVMLQTGINFSIIRDSKDIIWGDQWRAFIESAPGSAHFLLPIITESYFRSEPCKMEYQAFRSKEKAGGRHDLILPVYYSEVTNFARESDHEIRSWKEDIFSRQYFDWRELRHAAVRTKAYKLAITRMGNQIRKITETRNFHGDGQPISTLSNSNDQTHAGTEPLVSSRLARFLRGRSWTKFSEQIEERYGRLSSTQKNIMRFVYTTMHRKEISVDEMFVLFGKAYENEVETKAELFYRLKDLDHLGLIRLKGAGYKTSSVVALQSVHKASIEKSIIKT